MNFCRTASLCIALIASASASVRGQVVDSAAARARDSSGVQLRPVEVRASIAPAAAIGSSVPARIDVIGGRALEVQRGRALVDVLAAQPGVSLYDDLGSPHKLNLDLRGFTAGPTVGLPAGVSVFLDGVRQNEPDAQEVNFDLLPMEQVERIELLSGTASLLGPNSLGGAINLVTRRGAGPARGSLELTGGSFGAASGEAAMSGSMAGGWDYHAGGGYHDERGWREGTSATGYDGLLNLNRSDIGVQLRASRSRAATAGSLPESIFGVAPATNFTTGDYEDLDVQQLSLTGNTSRGTSRGSWVAYVRRSGAERFNVNQPPDADVRSFTSNTSLGGTVDWRWVAMLGPGVAALRAGVDGAANRTRVRIRVEPSSGTASDSLTTDVTSPGWDLAAFTIADFRISRVTLSAGARYDHLRVPFRDQLDPSRDTTSTFASINPRGGVSIELGDGRSAYASVGRSFRAPALLELACADPDAACPLPFALGDDPPLAPVKATTYEIGGAWALGAFGLNVSAYRTEVRNEIFFVASDEARLAGYFTNLARTRRDGGEASLRVALLGDRLTGYANYGMVRATFQSPAEIFSARAESDFAGSALAGANAVEPGDHIPLSPERRVKAGLAVTPVPGFDVGFDTRYVGPQWLRGDEANETQPLHSYTVSSVRARVERAGWELSMLVDNVLDARGATFGTFNENRRTGELERFLTPLTARAVKVSLRHTFGSQAK